MTSREPKKGDRVIVDGVLGEVSYVSYRGNGIDVHALEPGEFGDIPLLRGYHPSEYDQIVYADEVDNVSHPAHYKHASGIEVIEITKHESFLRGNIIKYVLRAPHKGSELEDLQKAAQYLQWEIDRVQETTSN